MDKDTLLSFALTLWGTTAKEGCTVTMRDAYSHLKGLMQNKALNKARVELVLSKYEAQPEANQHLLKRVCMEEQFDQDSEIGEAARTLLLLFVQHQATTGNHTISNLGSISGLVQGDYNTVHMTFEPAKIQWDRTFELVSQLDRRTFQLGDNAAATFPYVVAPIQEIFDQAIHTLHLASDNNTRTTSGILLVGESNAGKTRLALETIIKVLPQWSMLRWHIEYTEQNIPPIEILQTRKIVLFLDDLHEYALTQPSQRQETLSGIHALYTSTIDSRTALRTLLKHIFQYAPHTIIVATSRSEYLHQVRAVFGNFLLSKLKELSVPSFHPDIFDQKSIHVFEAFSRAQLAEDSNSIRISDWDGTLGSLVLGLQRKQHLYENLSGEAKTVLKVLKLLSLAYIFRYPSRHIQTIAVEVFGEDELQKNKAWRDISDLLLKQQFLIEDIDEYQDEIIWSIRKDSYFGKVITDYPSTNAQQEQDLKQLIEIFYTFKDTQAMRNLSIHYYHENSVTGYEKSLKIVERILSLEPENPLYLLGKGECFWHLQRYQEALLIFSQVTVLDPKNANAFYDLGICYFHLEQIDKALQAFDKTLVLDASFAYAWGSKGNCLTDLQQYQEALQAYERALLLSPYDTYIWYNQGNCLLKMEKYDEALQAYDAALALHPGFLDAWLNKGGCLHQLHRDEEACRAFDRALELDPHSALAWCNKGLSLKNLKQLEEASIALEVSLRLNAHNAQAWYGKGSCLELLDRLEEAIQAYDQTIALERDFTLALINKASCLIRLERFEEALAVAEQALELGPDSAGAWSNKGSALGGIQKYEEALQAYEQALRLDDESASIWFNTSKCLAHLERFTEALQAIEKATTLDPTNALFWSSKGAIYGCLGKYEDSLQAYEKVLELDSKSEEGLKGKSRALEELKSYEEAARVLEHTPKNNSEDWRYYAHLLAQCRKYQEAIQALEQAIALEPDHADSWYGKGDMLYHLGHYEGALTAIERFLQLKPDYAEHWYHKGMCLTRLERHREALTAYEEAVRLDPTDAQAWFGKAFSHDCLQQYPACLAAYEQTLLLTPDDAAAWYNKSVCLVQLGRYEEARQSQVQAMQLGFGSARDLQNMRQSIQFLQGDGTFADPTTDSEIAYAQIVQQAYQRGKYNQADLHNSTRQRAHTNSQKRRIKKTQQKEERMSDKNVDHKRRK